MSEMTILDFEVKHQPHDSELVKYTPRDGISYERTSTTLTTIRRVAGREHGLWKRWSRSNFKLLIVELRIRDQLHGKFSKLCVFGGQEMSAAEYDALLPIASQFSAVLCPGVAKRLVHFL